MAAYVFLLLAMLCSAQGQLFSALLFYGVALAFFLGSIVEHFLE